MKLSDFIWFAILAFIVCLVVWFAWDWICFFWEQVIFAFSHFYGAKVVEYNSVDGIIGFFHLYIFRRFLPFYK